MGKDLDMEIDKIRIQKRTGKDMDKGKEKGKEKEKEKEKTNRNLMGLIRRVHGLVESPDIEKQRHSQDQIGKASCRERV